METPLELDLEGTRRFFDTFLRSGPVLLAGISIVEAVEGVCSVGLVVVWAHVKLVEVGYHYHG